MAHRVGFWRYLWLHTIASSAGGGLLFLGTAAPLLLMARNFESVLSTLKLGGLFVVATVFLTLPFTLIFWAVHRSQGALFRSTAATIGALIAVVVYVLMIGFSGKVIRYSADFMLFFAVLIGSGIGGGLAFGYLLNKDAQKHEGKRML